MLKLFGLWNRIETAVLRRTAQGVFLFPILLTFLEVVRRYVFSATFKWSSEITIYSLLVASWLYFGTTLAEGGHLRITVLTDRMSKRLRGYGDIFAGVVGTAFCAILIWNCAVIIPRVLIAGSMFESLDIPIAVIFFAFLIAMVSLSVRYVEWIYHSVLGLLSRGRAPSPEPEREEVDDY
jgi:TRAP-type C4-dicarboxylate transport system permease small subunit